MPTRFGIWSSWCTLSWQRCSARVERRHDAAAESNLRQCFSNFLARITNETEDDIITYGKRMCYVKSMKCMDVEVLLDLAQMMIAKQTALIITH